MKYTIKIAFFAFTIILFGCKQDEFTGTNNGENPNSVVPTNAAHISVQDLLDFLPTGYAAMNNVVYKDESGNEKILKTAFVKGQHERTEYGRTYSYDHDIVRLYTEDDPNFRLEIDVYGLYTQSGEVQKVISAGLMPRNPSGSSSVSVIFNNGKPLVSVFDKFMEIATFHGKTFEKVYFSNSSLTQYTSYSEVDMNFTEGIVAFRDFENRLWIFDKFE